MRTLLSTILLAILPACAGIPRDTDVIVQDIGHPQVAGAHAYLAAKLNVSKPVILASGVLLEQGRLGESEHRGAVYVITIDYRLDGWAQHMVLIHEWAHILMWEDGIYLGNPHGEEWGKKYSRVLRLWIGEDE